MTFRIGVAGLGFMGQAHFATCQAFGNETGLVKVTAVADPEPARRAGHAPVQGNIDVSEPRFDMTGIECYEDAAEMIDRAELDIVFITLPTALHGAMSVRALRSGRHVFCEKPMALSLEEADEMVEAARTSEKHLMIGHVLRFWPEFEYLREAVISSRLGALRSLALRRLGAAPLWSWHDWMRDDRQCGGGLLDLQIHDIDVVNWVLGVPRAVSACGWNTSTTAGIDWVENVFDYGPGISVRSWGGWQSFPAFKGFETGYEALFERGWIRYNSLSQPRLVEYTAEAAEPIQPALSGAAHAIETRFFLQCIAEGKDPGAVISPSDARTTLQIALALRESARCGSAVMLER